MNYRVIALLCLLISGSSYADNHFELTADDRTRLGLTVFNGNFAVVTDQRDVVIPRGDVRLEFTDVALTIQPPTVTIESDEKKGFVAGHQNYRYDLLNRESLLERFVGRKVKYSRSLLENGTFETVLREGILLSINPEIVTFGDVIEINPEGTISLPSIPSDLRTTPTLVFQGRNKHEGQQNVSVRYHANDISWEADYTLTLAKRASLSGWVTVYNRSSSDFEVDDLQLIAGDVQRVSAEFKPRRRAMVAEMAMDASAVKPTQVGDYHSYDFPGQVHLLKNDMTQLRLVTAGGIRTEKFYRSIAHVQRFVTDAAEEQSPAIILSFKNDERNNLDLPLPAGNVRVYENKNKRVSFVGEASIDHTSAGSEIDLEIGRAFDVSVKRTQTQFRRLAERTVEVGYSIALRNSRGEKIDVILEEKLFGDWKVVDQSAKGRKKDARTLVFNQTVPAKGKATVTYLVRLDW